MDIQNKNNIALTDVSTMTRNEVIPFYKRLISSEPTNEEVIRVNQLILSKWTSSGLVYIKEKAWKA